jgi:NAD/NADP transhydrogenase beta subunit
MASSPQVLVRSIAMVGLAILAAWFAASALRYGLIEREDLGPLCEARLVPWWCQARMLVIHAFLHDVFGLASVAVAALALWRRSRGLALLAVAVGTSGMVLYNFAWGGVGVIGGTLALARLQGQWQQDGQPEREAHGAPGH